MHDMVKHAASFVAAALLAACNPNGNIPTGQVVGDPVRTTPGLPPGASVIAIREASARRTPSPAIKGRNVFTPSDPLLTRHGFRSYVLHDLEYGCEYVVADMSSEDVEAMARKHRVGGIVTQRCLGAGRGRGYEWVGRSRDMTVSTVRDEDMGCDFIAGSNNGSQGTFMVERMKQRPDGSTVQVCDSDRDLGT